MLDYGSAGYQVNLPDWAEFYNCDSKHLCQQKVNNHEFVAGSVNLAGVIIFGSVWFLSKNKNQIKIFF
jgi:hypothetical protein